VTSTVLLGQRGSRPITMLMTVTTSISLRNYIVDFIAGNGCLEEAQKKEDFAS
jgi:hypothetical protein